jgi:hypothetical protein
LETSYHRAKIRFKVQAGKNGAREKESVETPATVLLTSAPHPTQATGDFIATRLPAERQLGVCGEFSKIL